MSTQETPIKTKGKRGGKRPGAGRKPSRKSTVTEQVRKKLVDQGVKLPLEWLIDVMNDPKEPMSLRKECASEALPYCHSKMPTLVLAPGFNSGGAQPEQIGGIEQRVIGIEGDTWQVVGTLALTIDQPATETNDQDAGAGGVRPAIEGETV